MTKSDLIRTIAGQAGFSQAKAEVVLNAIMTTIGDALGKGDKVTLTGFGVFQAKTRSARIGRNPANGEPIQISERKTVVFKPGKQLAEKIEGK